MKRALAVFTLALLIVGCAPNGVDTSGKAPYLASISAMSEAMTEDKKHQFLRAIESAQYKSLISLSISNSAVNSQRQSDYDLAMNAYFLGRMDIYRSIIDKYALNDPLYMSELNRQLAGKNADRIIDEN